MSHCTTLQLTTNLCDKPCFKTFIQSNFIIPLFIYLVYPLFQFIMEDLERQKPTIIRVEEMAKKLLSQGVEDPAEGW